MKQILDLKIYIYIYIFFFFFFFFFFFGLKIAVNKNLEGILSFKNILNRLKYFNFLKKNGYEVDIGRNKFLIQIISYIIYKLLIFFISN